MGDRLKLHEELLKFTSHVYFQPPSTLRMTYPCIVYAKSNKRSLFGNDKQYSSNQGYDITVIDRNPDSEIADNLESHFQYCTITQYYTVDGLNHTTLTIYF